MSQNTFRLIAQHLVQALEPLRDAVEDLDSFRRFMFRLGWSVQSVPVFWSDLAQTIDAAVQEVRRLPDDPEFDEVIAALEKFKDVHDKLRNPAEAPAGVDPAAFLAEIAEKLFTLLITDYLARELPALSGVLEMVGVIEVREVEETPVRPAFDEVTLRFDRLKEFFTRPESLLEAVYGWGTPTLDWNLLRTHLADLFAAVSLRVLIVPASPALQDGYHPDPGAVDLPLSGSVRLDLFEDNIGDLPVTAGFDILDLPAEDSHLPGVVVQPAIPTEMGDSFSIADNLTLELRAGSDVASLFGILIRPQEDPTVRFPFDSSKTLPSAGFGTTLTFVRSEPLLLFGRPDATRLEVGGFKASLGIAASGGKLDVVLEIDPTGLRFVAQSGEGDGFIAKLLGDRKLEAPVTATLRWSKLRGLGFSGSGGFELTSAVHHEIGPIRLSALSLLLRGTDDNGTPALLARVGAAVSAQLGPVGVSLDNAGVRLLFKLQDGNLGPFDLGVGFAPPHGAGISIESGPVAGGGFLSFDPETGHYSGALALRIYEIEVSAFGIIDTKLPDGSRGFSFAILISARFTPIQLGYGFTLNGVGGMLGINRTVDTARLQDAVRRHTLDHVLFPQEPEKNALAILNDLGAFFPPAEGRYTFGPMAIIGWGNVAGESGRVSILEAELGIILELPEPIRLTILGQIKVGLPSLEKRFVKLNFDMVGVLDFAKKSFSLDASLYDSEVGGYTVNGDMALRFNWGEPRNFALAIGGFHPLYRAPAGFPLLRRVTVDLSNLGNPRLTLSGYLALTSNTFQVGATAELLASKGSFNIYGWIGFDALFTFRPFTFRADFSAGVALRRGTRHWASIHVSGTLSGPNPWHAEGEACLSLFFFDICVGFDLDLSSRSAEPITPLPNILDKLAGELSSPQNWSVEVPPAAHQVVSLVQAAGPDDRPLLDPLGTAAVKERILPLDQKIDRFEYGKLGKKDPNTFFISKITLRPGTSGATEITQIPVVTDYFARGQFQDMSDAAKLSLPAFELMNTGTKIGSGRLEAGGIQPCPTKYKTLIIDGPADESITEEYSPSPDLTARLARRSALALGGLRGSGPEKFFGGVGTVVTTSLGAEPFTIATVAGLVPRDDLLAVTRERLGFVTKGKAYDILAEHLDANRGDHGQLQVVPRLELPAAASR